jgi:hypothetical protein
LTTLETDELTRKKKCLEVMLSDITSELELRKARELKDWMINNIQKQKESISNLRDWINTWEFIVFEEEENYVGGIYTTFTMNIVTDNSILDISTTYGEGRNFDDSYGCIMLKPKVQTKKTTKVVTKTTERPDYRWNDTSFNYYSKRLNLNCSKTEFEDILRSFFRLSDEWMEDNGQSKVLPRFKDLENLTKPHKIDRE